MIRWLDHSTAEHSLGPSHIPPYLVERARVHDLHPPYNLGLGHQMTSNFFTKRSQSLGSWVMKDRKSSKKKRLEV